MGSLGKKVCCYAGGVTFLIGGVRGCHMGRGADELQISEYQSSEDDRDAICETCIHK